MNKALTNEANFAVRDPDFTDIPEQCEKWQRQVNEAVFGDRYSAYFEGTARQTGLAFAAGPHDNYTTGAGVSLVPGDTVFKINTAGPSGHVGIFVGAVNGFGPDCIAENSSTHVGRVRGACGYRTLEQWGRPELVVRFPDDAPSPRLIIARPHSSGWIYAASKSAQFDQASGHFTVNESEVGGLLGVAGASTRLPVRDALAALRWRVATIKDLMTDADPRMYVFTEPQ